MVSTPSENPSGLLSIMFMVIMSLLSTDACGPEVRKAAARSHSSSGISVQTLDRKCSFVFSSPLPVALIGQENCTLESWDTQSWSGLKWLEIGRLVLSDPHIVAYQLFLEPAIWF